MKNKKLIIMNFNGVIVDSFENTLQLTQFEFPGITEQQIRDLYDNNIFQSLAAYGNMTPSQSEIKEYLSTVHHNAQMKLEIINGMKSFF